MKPEKIGRLTRQSDRVAVGRGAAEVCPLRAGAQRECRQAGGAGVIDAGFGGPEFGFGGPEFGAACACFIDQRGDVAREARRRGSAAGMSSSSSRWLASSPMTLARRPKAFLQHAFGADAGERRLRPGGLRLQAVGGGAGADAVADFGGAEAFAAGVF
ncbi:MAG: hypothetical protein V9G23_03195 [Giesbergeria sp.]